MLGGKQHTRVKNMPRGPKGERRPADVNARAVMIAKIATGQIPDVIPTPESEGKDPTCGYDYTATTASVPNLPGFTETRLRGWACRRLGQSFIIENRPGAGTNIAIEAVVRAPADGYTLLMISAAAAINATLYDKLNYNLIRDNGQGFSSGQREIPLIASLRVLRALHSLEDESCRDVVEPFRQTTVSILCRHFIRRADYDEQNAKLQDMPHGRLPWLQGKSFAPLIT
jgi:hypothetical protein